MREQKALPLEAAIHKMTGATARALKLKDRGLLRPGFRADVIVFDPDDFADRATYAQPHQFPTGARTTVGDGQTIMAREVTEGDTTLTLRDFGGAPVWEHWGATADRVMRMPWRWVRPMRLGRRSWPMRRAAH